MAVRLHVKVCEAHDLLASDTNGKSDPYVTLRLKLGHKKDKLKTKTIQANLNPVWDEEFDLVTKKPAEDKLLIQVYDEDLHNKDDKICDEVELDLKDFPVSDDVKVLELSLVKKKKKKAGTLKLEITAFNADAAPAPAKEKKEKKSEKKKEEKKEEAPSSAEPIPCTLKVKLVKGTKLYNTEAIGKADPYGIIELVGYPKDDLTYFKSKVIDGNLNPVWDEEHTFQCKDWNKDVVKVSIWDKDIKDDDQIIDDILIPLSKLPLNSTVEWSEDVTHKGKPGGHLDLVFFAVDNSVKTRDVQIVDEKYCSFTLGSYSSSYSTDFSSYTCSHTLSAIHSSERRIHIHHHVTKKAVEAKPVKLSESITGTLVGCKNLIKADADGTDSYVTIAIVTKTQKEKKSKPSLKSEVVHDTSDPSYNLPFDFQKARKGDSLDVKVYQTHKLLGDVVIGQCIVPLKDVKENEPTTQDYPLQKPAKLPKALANFVEFGAVTLSLNHNVQYK